METLFSRLRSRGIAYAYPHVIPFDAEGRLPRHDREQMRAFLATARRVAPDLRVLPWIGGLRKGYKRQRPGTVELGGPRRSDSAWWPRRAGSWTRASTGCT